MSNTAIEHRPMFAIANTIRTAAFAVVVALGAALSLVNGAQAAQEVNIVDGYAVHGYDVVAYFTQGKPTEGNDRYTADYDGATYRFASAANRDKFAADPAAYAPQYGGFCAFGTAMGRKFDGDPHAWRIVDGKLYLNLNKKIQKRWLTDVPGFIRGADHNWPLISDIADEQLASNPPADLTQGAI